MRTLHVSIPVKAPARFTIAFLESYLRDGAQANGEPELRLRVPLKRLAGGIVLERPVTVDLRYLPEGDAGSPALSITWEAADTKLFPRFDGTVHAAPGGAQDCRLDIDGSYHVPFGLPGALFDTFAGVHIAQSTLDTLLRKFQAAIEADYAARVDG